MKTKEKRKQKITKKEYFEMVKKRTLKTILVALTLPIILLLGTPLDIYLNNYEEFKFAFFDIFPTCICSALIVALILFLILYFLPKTAYKFTTATILGIAFMFWAQGTFLNAGINALSGDAVGTTSVSNTMTIVNCVLWVAIIFLFNTIATINDKKGIVASGSTILSIIIIATQVIIPISAVFSKKDAFKSKLGTVSAESQYMGLSNANLTTVSTSNNIFYFCVDRFDESFAERVYQKDNQIFDNLTGFTWFQDNISTFAHTYPAVAHMLSDTEYNPELSRKEYLNSAYNETTPLSILDDNNYDINIFSQSYYAYTNASNLPSYFNNLSPLKTFKISNYFKFWCITAELSLYRTLPFIFKYFVSDVNSDSYDETLLQQCENGEYVYELDNEKVYNTIKNNFKQTNNKIFSFIHINGCHDCNKSSSSTFIGVSIEQSFKIINEYISKMKEMGVYDDATIIITGDHGCGTSDKHELYSSILTALFFKPSSSSNTPLVKSKAQTSHDNIWATIFDSENITTEKDYGASLFDISENVNQTRNFTFHTYGIKLVAYHYTITGSGKNFNNWVLDETKNYDKLLTS